MVMELLSLDPMGRYSMQIWGCCNSNDEDDASWLLMGTAATH